MHSLVRCNLAEYIIVSSNIHNTKDNYFKLKKSQANLIIPQNQYVNKCVNNWNLLKDNIVSFLNKYTAFKNVYYYLKNLF